MRQIFISILFAGVFLPAMVIAGETDYRYGGADARYRYHAFGYYEHRDPVEKLTDVQEQQARMRDERRAASLANESRRLMLEQQLLQLERERLEFEKEKAAAE
jgi:hypothetical protein